MTVASAGTARIIDGAAVARTIREELKAETAALVALGVQPGLSVVLVGDDPASAVYVRAKGKACEEAGMHSETIRMPASTTQAELLAVVDRLNHDPMVHGILVQMPPPRQIDPQAVILAINPAKDVDGFHPVNAGKLFSGDLSGFIPCTPLGVRELLLRHDIDTQGANAVVIGRSTIVGRPMAALLLLAGKGGDATVTVCHSRTRDLEAHLKRASIVIAAIGRREMITGDMLKPGAAVIDVGMNRVDDPSTRSGTRLYGDVHYPSASAVASWITPVPGGVGPMTIAMLLKNTITAARRVADRS